MVRSSHFGDVFSVNKGSTRKRTWSRATIYIIFTIMEVLRAAPEVCVLTVITGR